MSYQFPLVTEAGVVVGDDTLQFLDGLAPVVYAQCLILDGRFQNLDTLDVLSRVASCLRFNLPQHLLCPALSVQRRHDGHHGGHDSCCHEGIHVG